MKSKQAHGFQKTEIGKIPTDWDVDKLENHLTIKGRIGWKGLKKSEFGKKGNIIINGPDIKHGTINWKNCLRVPAWRYDESSEISVRTNDILLTKDGTIGKIAHVTHLPEPATLASGIFLIRNNSIKLDQNFLYHYFHSDLFINLVKSRIEGSVIPHLYQRDIVKLSIPLPSMPEQHYIASVLSSLETKIELNKKMNKILEQIAQAIFKSWFVDFYGVTEFEDSELGKIPKGWAIKNLGDVCEIVMGQSPPSTSYNKDGEGVIFFQGKTDFGDFFPAPRIYCTSPKKFAEKNDVLFTVRAPIAAINIARKRYSIGRGLASLRLKDNHGSFLYYFLKNSFEEWQKFEGDGTVYGAVTKDDVCNFKILTPPSETIILFNQTIDPLYYSVWKNNEQMQYLKKILDMLLPKLMSGEIRV